MKAIVLHEYGPASNGLDPGKWRSPRVAQRDALSTEMTSRAGLLFLLSADQQSARPLTCERRGAAKDARKPLRLECATRCATRGIFDLVLHKGIERRVVACQGGMVTRATGGLEEIDQVPVGIEDTDCRDAALGKPFLSTRLP